MAKSLPLTLKQRRFIEAFLGPCAGNGTKAAIAAGYSKKTAHVIAQENLRKPAIRKALDAKMEKREKKAIATANERDALLTDAARDTRADWEERIAAIKELNKVEGRHVQRVDLSVNAVPTPERLMRMSDRELLDELLKEREKVDALIAEYQAKVAALPAVAVVPTALKA